MRGPYSAPSAGSSSRMPKHLAFEGERLDRRAGVTALRERRFALRRKVCAVGEKPAIPKVVDVHLQPAGNVDAPAVPFFARRQPRISASALGAARARRVESGAEPLDLRIDPELQCGFGRFEEAAKRLRAAATHETIRVFSGREQHDAHGGSGVLDRLRRDVDGFGCSRAPGCIAVEAQEDVIGVLAQLGRLLGGERRAQRRYRVLEAGLMEGDAVEVALRRR